MGYESEKRLLPAYPKTFHLPWKPNTTRDDAVASEEDAAVIFDREIVVEEKIDGASVGISFVSDHPLVRNREHILNKGYIKKETTAKLQFRSLWGWVYEHEKQFKKLACFGSYSVYGEWMLAQHGIRYDNLPDWFIAYDLYDHNARKFMAPLLTRALLMECGFQVVPLLHQGVISSYAELEEMANRNSAFVNLPMEGVYVRTKAGQWLDHRFKMVRESFVRGEHWDNENFKKNVMRGR
jgi:hypothetical protein